MSFYLSYPDRQDPTGEVRSSDEVLRCFRDGHAERRDVASGAGLAALLRTKLTGETWTWLLVAVGVILRVMEYGDNRKLYMDEQSLLDNLVRFACLSTSARP